jgi:hypothetical protein
LFSSTVIDDASLTDTTRQVTGLSLNTVYYWRVRAQNAAGSSGYSEVWDFRTAAEVTNQYPVNAGWNMISIALAVPDGRTTVLYPTATTGAFSYVAGTGYVQRDTLTNGMGYWLKFGTNQTVGITGSILTSDTIGVQTGWNMIGSISSPVDTASIVSIPPGNLQSLYYGYSGGYSPAATIVPGMAYWLKANGPGQLIMTSSGSSGRPATAANEFDRFYSLAVTDSRGSRQILYLGSDVELLTGSYELPPPGPEGVFDVRFASQRMVEVYSEGAERSEHPIEIRSAEYPLTVAWDFRSVGGRVFRLRDGVTGTIIVPRLLSGRGELKVTDPAVHRLVLTVEPVTVPTEVTLLQNYPNPFNPSTVIRFGLPQKNHVRLELYNTLGQRVAKLVDELMDGGYHEVVFENPGLASGVYFYRLTTTNFTQTRRLVLVQ